MLYSIKNAIVEEVFPDFITKGNNRLFIKRDDLIDEFVSGNKWRKLKFNILKVQQEKFQGIITFGGAFSNHLIATAAACHKANIKSIGIVRGDELNCRSNETLKNCTDLGMELKFISRSEYNDITEEYFLRNLKHDYPNFYIVPEGGANYLGMVGCQEIWNELDTVFDDVFVACGTSTTAAGLLMGIPEKTKLWTVSVLKGYDGACELKKLYQNSCIDDEQIQEWMNQIEFLNEFHFGGYGKYNEELLNFIDTFHKQTNVQLDQVYTGKAMYALSQTILKNQFNQRNILFIHTGGLQGLRGLKK